MTAADPCKHTLITVIDGVHVCADCGAPTELRTNSGKILTPADIDEFVAEAERGYDLTGYVELEDNPTAERWHHPITRYPKKWRRR